MENKIHSLPKDLINKIAAGEVVERPASIVKELVENAIDAGATNISISLEKSGLDSITIADNGIGMNKFEVEESFKQHTTSKISNYEDLFNITTLGFRGEALASISSVAKVVVHTFNGIDNPVNFSIFDKEIKNSIGTGRGIGTTMIVSNIFQNIPARRKFLKSEDTEYKYIAETFMNIALSKPNISFSLIKNGKTIYKLSKAKEIKYRILDIFKIITDQDLIPINFNNGIMEINGLLGHPRSAKNINKYQYIFINNRFIKNPLIHKAVKEGYSTSIMNGTEPMYFLFFNIKPSEIDVNVHPRKLEVRFNNPNIIFSNTKFTISKTLESFSKEKFHEMFDEDSHKSNKTDTFQLQSKIDLNKPFTKGKELSLNGPSTINFQRNNFQLDKGFGFSKTLLQNTEEISKELIGNQTDQFINDFIQVFNTYIIIEKEGKILLIDQHAAHERINFEKLKKIIEDDNSISSQSLLIPINFSVEQITKEQIFINKAFLNKIGFYFDIKGSNIVINEIPNSLKTDQIKEVFYNILEELETTEGQGSNSWLKVQNKIIATIACHSSIRAGQKLDKFVISQLIKDLFKCKLPYSCPHGRPFYIEITREELEKQFKRTL